MEIIQNNHWFVDKNRLAISFMRFFVDIQIQIVDGDLDYVLSVYDSFPNQKTFHFPSLEDAIHFAEEVVSKKEELSDIVDSYPFHNKSDQLRIPGTNVTEDGKINLTEEEVYDSIMNYYGPYLKGNMKVLKELHFCGDFVDVLFYLVVEDDGIAKKVMLTEWDLENVFQHYLSSCDLSFVGFKYIGHKQNIGNKEIPVFEGVQLQTKKKNMEYQKKWLYE